MRQLFSAALLSCVALLAASPASAQAQGSYAALTSGYETTTSAGPVGNGTAVTAPEATATMVLTGHVKTAAGPLPGAVVKVANSSEMAVTDADGSFHLTVPVSTHPVQATASYAGFADQPVVLDATSSDVSLSVVHVIKIAKKQQLKTYLKTARKQVRKNLHAVRR